MTIVSDTIIFLSLYSCVFPFTNILQSFLYMAKTNKRNIRFDALAATTIILRFRNEATHGISSMKCKFLLNPPMSRPAVAYSTRTVIFFVYFFLLPCGGGVFQYICDLFSPLFLHSLISSFRHLIDGVTPERYTKILR